jgi:ornithine cyclodeaminase/alanine dehydrogenase-like protein (mu-crystallin family)
VTLLLREADVQRLLRIEDVITALDAALQQWAAGHAENQPRRRVRGGTVLAIMSAALPERGLIGFKAYTAGTEGVRFWVHLFDSKTGRPVAIIEADHLGRLRTGAASGLATRYMAREDASILAQFGTGTQALTQALGVIAVRPIREVRIVGRNASRRHAFVRALKEKWTGGSIVELGDATQAIAGAHVVTTITSSADPLFEGRLLEPGQHLNVAGSNQPRRREIDGETVARASLIVADDADAARIEAGDLLLAEAEGRLDWARVRSLREVVSGNAGRRSPDEITLFKSVGLAIEDLAAAALVLERARAAGVGENFPLTPTGP